MLSERGERLPIATAMQVCVQVADVLAMAHEQGIVHRDIKPENLMLVADPVAMGGERVKVLDFGIAKLTDQPRRSEDSDESGDGHARVHVA
jgi:serine/threonine protein kinase